MNPSALAGELLDLFLPRGCLGCGERIPPEGGPGLVCHRCLTLLREPPAPRCARCDLPLGTGQPAGEACLECLRWPSALHAARSAVILEPPADALVHALKYGGWQTLAGAMGRRMARVRLPVGPRPLLVPVPTTPRRRRARGYNQARVLAQAVADVTGFPLVDALERPEGRTQVRLTPRERRANVEGSFRLSSPDCSRIRGREVILVDDVLTTGATAFSAAGTLVAGGAGRVVLLTFARALPYGSQGRPRLNG